MLMIGKKLRASWMQMKFSLLTFLAFKCLVQYSPFLLFCSKSGLKYVFELLKHSELYFGDLFLRNIYVLHFLFWQCFWNNITLKDIFIIFSLFIMHSWCSLIFLRSHSVTNIFCLVIEVSCKCDTFLEVQNYYYFFDIKSIQSVKILFRIGRDCPDANSASISLSRLIKSILTLRVSSNTLATLELSPIQILTKLKIAWVQCSYENWYFELDKPLPQEILFFQRRNQSQIPTTDQK